MTVSDFQCITVLQGRIAGSQGGEITCSEDCLRKFSSIDDTASTIVYFQHAIMDENSEVKKAK